MACGTASARRPSWLAGGADVRALDGAAAAGGSAVYLASETAGLLAAFEFSSVVRTGAVALVAELRARGIGVHLLSGDSQQAAHTIGAAVGIEDARGDLAPRRQIARRARHAGARTGGGDGRRWHQ